MLIRTSLADRRCGSVRAHAHGRPRTRSLRSHQHDRRTVSRTTRRRDAAVPDAASSRHGATHGIRAFRTRPSRCRCDSRHPALDAGCVSPVDGDGDHHAPSISLSPARSRRHAGLCTPVVFSQAHMRSSPFASCTVALGAPTYTARTLPSLRTSAVVAARHAPWVTQSHPGKSHR